MARVPRGPPQEPPGASPLVPISLQPHPGWLGILQPICKLALYNPTPPSHHSMLPWFCHPLCPLCWQGHVSSSAPHRGCPPHSSPHPQGPQRRLDLCPWVPAPSGLPVHLQIAWPVLAHFTLCLLSTVTTAFLGDRQNPDKEASHALGGLSAHLSPVCLLGHQQMCPPLWRLLPQPLLAHPSSSISALTPSILHPSGSEMGLGHPAPTHPHSGSKPSTWPRKIRLEVPTPACGPAPLSGLSLPCVSTVHLFVAPCGGGSHPRRHITVKWTC